MARPPTNASSVPGDAPPCSLPTGDASPSDGTRSTLVSSDSLLDDIDHAEMKGAEEKHESR
jgi:hypothetical protein